MQRPLYDGGMKETHDMVTRRPLLSTLAAPAVLALPAACALPAGTVYRGPVSDHFDGERFFNPGGAPPRSLVDVIRWQASGGRIPWPKRVPSCFHLTALRPASTRACACPSLDTRPSLFRRVP
jgi:hypothetical protein